MMKEHDSPADYGNDVARPTQLLPEEVDDPECVTRFYNELWTLGPRARKLAQILHDYWDKLRLNVFRLEVDDDPGGNFLLIMISSKEDSILRLLGVQHGFPRGYPILWEPGARLHLLGFYPKFDNDDNNRSILPQNNAEDGGKPRRRSQVTPPLDRLSFTVKWSGFLFCLISFRSLQSGRVHWFVTSKNSGNCTSAKFGDFTKYARELLIDVLGDKLNDAVTYLADNGIYVCGEALSRFDQHHGYGYKKDAAFVTCAGTYDNQYSSDERRPSSASSSRRSANVCPKNALLQHYPLEKMQEIAQKIGLRYVQNVQISADILHSFVKELENSRDFLTTTSVITLFEKYNIDTSQLHEHNEVIDSDILEGFIMVLHYAPHTGRSPDRIKWKLPHYTFVTMFLRPIWEKRELRESSLIHCFELAQVMSKKWCITEEGKEYYHNFAICAVWEMLQVKKDDTETAVEERMRLRESETPAVWIVAAEKVAQWSRDHVLERGKALLQEAMRKMWEGSVVKDINKHDSMGCAVVTLHKEEDVQRLVAMGPQVELFDGVMANIKQHTDKGSQEPHRDKIFLGWGRQVEKQLGTKVETIVRAVERLLEPKNEGTGTRQEETEMEEEEGDHSSDASSDAEA